MAPSLHDRSTNHCPIVRMSVCWLVRTKLGSLGSPGRYKASSLDRSRTDPSSYGGSNLGILPHRVLFREICILEFSGAVSTVGKPN